MHRLSPRVPIDTKSYRVSYVLKYICMWRLRFGEFAQCTLAQICWYHFRQTLVSQIQGKVIRSLPFVVFNIRFSTTSEKCTTYAWVAPYTRTDFCYIYYLWIHVAKCYMHMTVCIALQFKMFVHRKVSKMGQELLTWAKHRWLLWLKIPQSQRHAVQCSPCCKVPNY